MDKYDYLRVVLGYAAGLVTVIGGAALFVVWWLA